MWHIVTYGSVVAMVIAQLSLDKDSLFTFSCQIAQKYDPQKEEELRIWIEDVTGQPIGNDFQKGLKSGVILCEWVILQ